MLPQKEVVMVDKIPDGKWVAKVRVASHWYPHPEDKRTPVSHCPLTEKVQHWAQVLGVNANEVSTVLTRERRTTPEDVYGNIMNEQELTLISDKPFVGVHFRDYDLTGNWAKLHRGLTVARQIHKGEQGKFPDLLRRPEIHPSQFYDPDSWDEGRQKLNWVKLPELAEIVSLNFEEIIRGYAGFSRSSYYEPNVPILQGSFDKRNIVRIYVGDVPKGFCGGETAWGGNNAIPITALPELIDHCNGEIWVPQSFAYTVIRLTQFGYRPNNETPTPSFRLEAPMPEAPQRPLPVLPVEELRELHELRQILPRELTNTVFRQTAEAVFNSTNWQPAPQLDDSDRGLGMYYCNFQTLQMDDEGTFLVLGYGDWTRAGASKTDNYYCGMLGVFPQFVDDARRDPSAILRIWFWPGEVLRETPTGSKGGLCPPEMPENIAVLVRRFLTGLGYTL